jgi:hypothetical protein
MGLKRLGVYRKKERKLGGDARIRKRLQDIWYGMHRRCHDPGDGVYRFYGAKGARVSEEWHGFEPFYSWAVSGYRPGLCLTRIDHEGPYSPANSTWTTRSQAGWGAKHPPRKAKPRWNIRAFGEVKGPTAWSRDSRCRVTLGTLIARLRGGMEPAKAITMFPKGGVGPTTRFVAAFGETKGITVWSRDRRCRVTLTTLCRRLQSGLDPEAAIATPPFKLPFRSRTAGGNRGSGP